LNAEPESLLASQLVAGERLLWSGQPRQGVFLRASDAFLIPFSLLWGGFAIFWEYSVLSMGEAPLFFALWGLPFVVIGLYFIAGRFFVDAKQRANTVFGVTNQRVLIMSGLFNRKVKSVNLRTLSDISLDERANGTGTVSFGPTNPFALWGSAGMAWPGMPTASPAFELIPNARSVYEIVRKAQAGAA
jgi:hypothetical protein